MRAYLKANKVKLVLGLSLCALSVFGLMDAQAAALGGVLMLGDVEPTSLKELNTAMMGAFKAMQDKVKANQDLMDTAINEVKREGVVYAKTADDLKKLGEEGQKAQKEFKDAMNAFAARMTTVEQKMDAKPAPGKDNERKSIGELFTDSDQYKALMKATNHGSSKKGWDSEGFDAPRTKAAILNPNPLSNDNPLVAPDRLTGIIMPGLRRFTVRDLLPNLRTASNLVEFAQELLFTNNAAPQYDSTSPDPHSESALKAESALTFQLANAPVTTLAHYIPASRQILSDAAALAGYINSRLIYGLKLEEENELLNGAGTAGTLTGLRTSQTTFSGGATNQTAIDTLLKAFTQVSLSYFEASGVVLHPTDWQNILLLKDSQNRYLFADPHSMNVPMIWGKPVVPTQAITQGQFLVGAFDLAAAIYDREDVTIRVAEQHSDWFARNLVAILCEERLALATYRTAALVGGAISYAG